MKNYLPQQYLIDQSYKIKHNYLTEQFQDYKIIMKKIEKVVNNNDLIDLYSN